MRKRISNDRPKQPLRVADILQRMDALPTLDDRPDEEILGYDENGVPAKGETLKGERLSRRGGSGRG